MAQTRRTSTLIVLRAADPLELALLQHAQQLRLEGAARRRRSRRGTACRRRPARSGPCGPAVAPVNAPFSWPNSSDSSSGLGQGRAVHLDERLSLRGESVWMARAISSLPVPLSPRSSTVERVGATRWICANTSCIGFELPTTLSILAGISPRPMLAARSRRRQQPAAGLLGGRSVRAGAASPSARSGWRPLSGSGCPRRS